MKIYEAINNNYCIGRESNSQQISPNDLNFTLTKEDLLADDWKIYYPNVTININEFTELIAKTLKECYSKNKTVNGPHPQEILMTLKNNLFGK